MKKHIKVFLEFWDLGEQDFIVCLGCERAQATDVHHISKRQMGGSKKKDIPTNLAPLCRVCHSRADTNKDFNKYIDEKLQERIALKNWKTT
jgi:5-methylcytosine-specific restriction endonuclease McrA|tara:strand:+ start:228 stop:500 length:273 start_codon:yes stop_codon:yes gene_type:complete